MKKLTALISALALLLSLCACSGQAVGPKGGASSPEPGAASQAAGGDVSQDDKGPGEEPPVTPPIEGDVLEPNVSIDPNEEPQPPANAPEPDPAPAAPTPPPAPEPEPKPEPKPDPKPEQAPPPEPKPEQTPSPEPEPVPAADPKTTAQGLIGRPVSELYAAIGRPISSDYAPGCLEPDSEDGELIYSGFTVYTVRTATREYVYDIF